MKISGMSFRSRTQITTQRSSYDLITKGVARVCLDIKIKNRNKLTACSDLALVLLFDTMHYAS